MKAGGEQIQMIVVGVALLILVWKLLGESAAVKVAEVNGGQRCRHGEAQLLFSTAPSLKRSPGTCMPRGSHREGISAKTRQDSSSS